MNRLVAVTALTLAVHAVFAQGHGGPGGPGGGSPGPQLLRKVFEMRKSVKLAAIRTVQFLEQGERRLVTEKIVRDGVNVRTEILDGRLKGQISVEDEHERRVWSPSENVIRVNPAREAEFFSRFKGMSGRPDHAPPQAKETDGGNVAGVPTRQLEFSSPEGRVFSRTWIDPVHGVVLKNQTFDRDGKLNGSFEYTSLKFNPSLAQGTFQINKPGAKIITPEDDLRRLAREMGVKAYRVRPATGWRLVAVRKMNPKGTTILMQVYKNQRSRVSLFVIQGPVDAERLRKMQDGKINSHVWDIGSVHLALIGDLPVQDLRRLADQVGD